LTVQRNDRSAYLGADLNVTIRRQAALRVAAPPPPSRLHGVAGKTLSPEAIGIHCANTNLLAKAAQGRHRRKSRA
jgi:hypothetical protein